MRYTYQDLIRDLGEEVLDTVSSYGIEVFEDNPYYFQGLLDLLNGHSELF